MKSRYRITTVLLLALALTGTTFAQNGERLIERVTPEGTWTQIERCNLPTAPGSEAPSRPTSPGLMWTYPDGGLLWVGNSVSVGNRGTQIAGVCELNNERVELFSIFDGNPPTPIWTDTSIHGTDTGYMCSSSLKPDYHVVMYHVNSPDIMNRIPTVHCYTTSSSTPIWTWSYPSTINAATRLAIDRNATVVAIAVYNNNTGMIDLFFLDPATGAVKDTYSQAAGGLRGFDLSADGSTLYFHDAGSSTCYIFDIATLTVTFDAPTGGGFDGHCISGDGTKFANGRFGQVWIWEKSGSTWGSHVFSTGSGNFADEMDFSDDGSTLGFGVTQYSPKYNKTEGYMLDIPTKTVVAHVVNNSSGLVVQDVCSSAAISHDGRYFALGRWGDDLSVNPEVQILERDVGLAGTIDTNGSVFSVDISWDGQVVAAADKAVHANIQGNGGDFYYHDLGGEDMDLIGIPRIGLAAEIKVYTGPNWFFALILGTQDDPGGIFTYSFGTLYLDLLPPNLFLLLPVMVADSSGTGTLPIILPNDPALVGFSVFFQSLFAEPGKKFNLSEDYLTMTLLP